MTLTRASPVKLLRIRFTGSVGTQLFRRDPSMTSQSSTVTIFKDIHTCLGSASLEDPPVAIEPGEHIFPFSFRVPPTSLPASFEGVYGQVRYQVSAVLVRPGHVNRTISVPLTIPSTLDASDAEYRDGVDGSASGPVGFWLWKSGHIDLAVSMPKAAYGSEEIIPLT
ncbi:Arrestin domain-containing protein 4, partial [Quaeritorhiza haematococci]